MSDDPISLAAYKGVVISQQEPGTIVRDPRTGAELAVTDTRAINLGHTIYVTPKVYRAIKRATHPTPTTETADV